MTEIDFFHGQRKVWDMGIREGVGVNVLGNIDYLMSCSIRFDHDCVVCH